MRNIHEVIVRPVVTEKSTNELDRLGAYTFQVARRREQDRDPPGGREAVQREGEGRAHHAVPRQAAPRGQAHRPRAAWKKAIVTLAEGDTIEDLRGGLTDVDQAIQAGDAGHALPLDRQRLGDHARGRRRSRCSSRSRRAAGATTTAASPPAVAAAVTSASTGSSTSSATSRACRRRSRTSSTIRTAARTSRWSSTRTARSATSCTPSALKVGDTVVAGPGSDIRSGNALPLGEIPLGTTVHNIELRPGKGGQMARSAGAGVQVVAKEGDYVTLRMPSTEVRMVRRECMATIGPGRQRRPRASSRSARPAPTAGAASARRCAVWR